MDSRPDLGLPEGENSKFNNFITIFSIKGLFAINE